MRIAYLDCFAGISGDMFLGALVDAGLDPAVLHQATAALNLNATLKIEKVDRSGISSTKVHVYEGANLAEETHVHPPEDNPSNHQQIHTHQHNPKIQHHHKPGHAHDHSQADPQAPDDPKAHEHSQEHTHGRSLTVIRDLINDAPLAPVVKQTAIHAFELLGASEAKIHNVPIEKIHFHEVGAVDAIVDIVAASAGIHALNAQAQAKTGHETKWHCPPLNVGGGMVDCAHGRFPVPAPATADLLRGLPTYSAHIKKELVTPTGAALIRALAPTFGPQPPMRVQHIGYGAGTRNPKELPNVLRLSLGDADEADSPALQQFILRETSTLGVRIHHEQRSCLDRAHTTVVTPYGEIRIKVGSRNGEIFNAAPEFEDCRAVAAQHNVPLKIVQQAAIAAYRR